ncbi:MAG: ornithine cyclodeaminase family protein [Pseudomonadota bacterium]
MIPYLTGSQLRSALPYPTLIDALRLAFQQTTVAPTRHVHTLSEEDASVLLLMPVWQPAGNMGVKLVTVAPANPARQLATVHSIFILFDTTTGVPIAMLDGEELTLRRTAAASALASTYLSRSDSKSLLVVGTGKLAPYMAAGHCAVRPISTISVWGRSADHAEQTIRQLHGLDLPDGVTIERATDLEWAARDADIITCATTSTAPIVLGDWIRPGTHVDLAGGFKPDMREADDRLLARATIFVDTFAGALAEAGDLIQPMAAGHLQREAIVAELADLAAGRHKGRSNVQEITVFKSVGTGIEDLCAANLAWAYAHRKAA